MIIIMRLNRLTHCPTPTTSGHDPASSERSSVKVMPNAGQLIMSKIEVLELEETMRY